MVYLCCDAVPYSRSAQIAEYRKVLDSRVVADLHNLPIYEVLKCKLETR